MKPTTKRPAMEPKPRKRKPLTAEDIRQQATWQPLTETELRLIEELEAEEQQLTQIQKGTNE